MNFVWLTSYLCIFLLGGIASLFIAYKLINHELNKAEKELTDTTVHVDVKSRLEPHVNTMTAWN